MLKKRKNLAISSQVALMAKGSETIIGITLRVSGIVHSLWKQGVLKEAVGPGAIPGGATIVIFLDKQYN